MSYIWPDCKHATYTNGNPIKRTNRFNPAILCQIYAKTVGALTAGLTSTGAEYSVKV